MLISVGGNLSVLVSKVEVLKLRGVGEKCRGVRIAVERLRILSIKLVRREDVASRELNTP